MTLNRWDPLRDLLNFQERANRLLEWSAEEHASKRRATWCPVVDVLETPEAYIFRAELPGVGKEHINVEIRGNRLRLYGERHMSAEPAIAAYHSIERVHGVFERNFELPGLVDAEQAEARYLDGVLEIVLPKVEEESDRPISIVCLG
jgi:HSP20 family protein